MNSFKPTEQIFMQIFALFVSFAMKISPLNTGLRSAKIRPGSEQQNAPKEEQERIEPKPWLNIINFSVSLTLKTPKSNKIAKITHDKFR